MNTNNFETKYLASIQFLVNLDSEQEQNNIFLNLLKRISTSKIFIKSEIGFTCQKCNIFILAQN